MYPKQNLDIEDILFNFTLLNSIYKVVCFFANLRSISVAGDAKIGSELDTIE